MRFLSLILQFKISNFFSSLQGENVRLELLEATKILPSIFSEILQVLNNDSILKAMNYYQDFVRDVHTEKEVCN